MNRSPHHRPLLKMAQFLELHYQQRPPPQLLCDFPLERWQQAQQLQHKYHLASRCGYHAAAEHYQRQLQQSLRWLVQGLSNLSNDLSQQCHRSVPNLRLLYDELQFLFDEFELVELDWDGKEILVQTERIMLEAIDLGPFQIRLKLWHLGEFQSYQVIALDPYPPACHDDIPHPHVQSKILCEGEGKLAIAQALKDGRLGEFFVLVRQILQTYNDGSAYHSLSEWNNSPCSDCGAGVDSDEACSCDRCQADLCSRCTNCCHCCSDTLCTECHNVCEACHNSVCDHCLSRCSSCDEPTCTDCLQEEMCSSCYEDFLENQHAETEEPTLDQTPLETSPEKTTTTPSHVAIQSFCLGEATVPA